MPGNTFGQLFRVTTCGESHGGALACIVDGCPPLLELSESDIQKELNRRRPGQSQVTTPRDEKDQVQILSGVFEGKTLGSPILMLVKNEDAHSEDYLYLKDKYRPSHSDFTYDAKYGIRAYKGGGRASARETVARVMAGAIAKKFLREKFGIEILAFVSRIKDIEAHVDMTYVSTEDIEKSIVRCPDVEATAQMESLILEMKEKGNSVGGVVTCLARNVPPGLGEPVFDRLEADLAKACLSIPAAKGFEIGSGFSGTFLTGKDHNDAFYKKENGHIGTRTNHSGGIQGGISNGEDIYLNVAFKPTSTILMSQETVNQKGESISLDRVKGRHDPCVLPRAVPIVEAMMALTLMDHALRQGALIYSVQTTS